MKWIVLLLVLPFAGRAQNTIREQIGISVWRTRDSIFVDSSISYKIFFDSAGRKTGEWQVYYDLAGNIVDTNIALVDTAGRHTYFYGGHQHWYYVYDSSGNEVSITIYRPTDTVKIEYQLDYDERGRLLTKTDKSAPTGEKYLYTYAGDTMHYKFADISWGSRLVDSRRLPLYIEDSWKEDGLTSRTVYNYQRDNAGNALLYTKTENGVLKKKTTHIYKNGRETSQVEEFFNPDYRIETRFYYKHW